MEWRSTIKKLGSKEDFCFKIVVVFAVVCGCWFLYQYEGTNFDIYLFTHFKDNGLILAQVAEAGNITGTPPDLSREVIVRILAGDATGKTVVALDQFIGNSTSSSYFPISSGENVLLSRDGNTRGTWQYYLTDRYRFPEVLLILLFFIIIALVVGRIRGLTSISGLAISILVLMFFVVPRILAGNDPLLVCVGGAIVIALVSLYLAHGFNRRTTVALFGTALTLVASVILSVLFVRTAQLIAPETEDSIALESQANINLNWQGLLLGGIIIGALGLLDDVTIGQSVAVYELKKAAPHLKVGELYQKGMSIGREHIASLINTLFLAYAGVALPTILYLVAVSGNTPIWLTMNDETLIEEVVRTVVGSIGIILAVPITTFLAAWIFGRSSAVGRTETLKA